MELDEIHSSVNAESAASDGLLVLDQRVVGELSWNDNLKATWVWRRFDFHRGLVFQKWVDARDNDEASTNLKMKPSAENPLQLLR